MMHGFYQKKLGKDPGVDKSLSFQWKENRYVISEYEISFSAFQDQELPANYLRNKRVLNKDYIPK